MASNNIPKYVGWLTILSTPLVSGTMWLSRRRELNTGLPCDARGTQGCLYDANLAAVYGLVAGSIFALVALFLVWLQSRKFKTIAQISLCGNLLLWVVVASVLIHGTHQL